ncbi:hypothetical protein O6072_22970 [Mycolicibacterium neoaurum]|uniref:hypothetical protein n=1 Tax=Mycolicibacterium neoaurum TaxID=1795 RepID=UPI00248BDA2F|nr:hypothetical protein [Mycolicibacterium neoaurum]WBP93863.1 hypothetical protein O7W24_22465 [Mycolicibacterium neoaurum]WBS07656.1 hypothetical protein O6072_22970 [Mycolicibacterium neoaurum]
MSSVEHYQELTDDLATETAAAVLTVYAAMQAGTFGPNATAAAIATVIATANAAATTLADLFVATQIEAQTRVPQLPTGIAPRDDTTRLVKAVETIIDDLPEPKPAAAEPRPAAPKIAVGLPDVAPEIVEHDDEPDPVDTAAKRLERLARSEPLETGVEIVVEVMNRLPVVEGWRRVLDADPCERCVRWAEDGRVFPKGHHFKRHLQCNCQPEVVVDNRERITL